MRYLLDTSIWLWSIGSVGKINQLGRDLLADHEGPVGEHECHRLAAGALAGTLGGGRANMN